MIKNCRAFTGMLALFFCLSAISNAEDTPKRILFIGNSYTAVNNLPEIFKKIVGSGQNKTPEIKASTPGGRTLEKHLSETSSMRLIDEGNWDVVVLQGQSQEAAMSEEVENVRADFLHGATELYKRVKAKSPDAKIVFYQTWARHADFWANPKKPAPVGKDPIEMQARNRKWYKIAADKNHGSFVAPAGDAWERNYKNPQALRLHAKDNSHPLFKGSYLAGLVIYGTIYRPKTLSVSYHGNLADPEAAYLQRIASETLK